MSASRRVSGKTLADSVIEAAKRAQAVQQAAQQTAAAIAKTRAELGPNATVPAQSKKAGQ